MTVDEELARLREALVALIRQWDALTDCTPDARWGVLTCRDDLNTALMLHDAACGRAPASVV